jgi:hydrogenase-4 component F
MPPFNIFISEFTVLKAIVDKGLWAIAVLFLLCVVLVFYGMLSGFGRMLFGGNGRAKGAEHEKTEDGDAVAGPVTISSALNNGIMVLLASLIIVFGVTVPGFIDTAIKACIGVLGVK